MSTAVARPARSAGRPAQGHRLYSTKLDLYHQQALLISYIENATCHFSVWPPLSPFYQLSIIDLQRLRTVYANVGRGRLKHSSMQPNKSQLNQPGSQLYGPYMAKIEYENLETLRKMEKRLYDGRFSLVCFFIRFLKSSPGLFWKWRHHWFTKSFSGGGKIPQRCGHGRE